MLELHDVLQAHQSSVQGLWVPSAIKRISKPTAFTFLRDYVATSTPVIISDAIECDTEQWTAEALLERAGSVECTINVTPTGHGDCVTADPSGAEVFVMPEERRMAFADFIAALQDDRQV